MRRLLARLLAPRPATPLPRTLEEEIAALAARWSAAHPGPVAAAIDAHFEALRRDGTAPDDETLAMAAAALGEDARRAHGGAWREDPFLGLVLAEVGGIAKVRLRALDAVRKKAQLGAAFRMEGFAARLPGRIAAEGAQAAYHDGPPDMGALLATLRGGDADALREAAGAWRAFWKSRFGQEIPFSLRMVKDMDAFLRTHYLVFALHEATLAHAGLYVGEVARGLFGGTWQPLPAGAEVHRLALAWPELTYYPVGRVFRMMSECPEGEGLGDYVRLIPAARKELRGQGAS
jgi:hypothetical protein